MVNNTGFFITLVVFALVAIKFLMGTNELKKRDLNIVPNKTCPGLGGGKLHVWTYDYLSGRMFCTICKNKPNWTNDDV